MGKIIDLTDKFDNSNKIKICNKFEESLCIIIQCIGSLTRNIISLLPEAYENSSNEIKNINNIRVIHKNNEEFLNQFYTILELMNDSISKKAYQNQIKLICNKFPDNIKETIFEYLNELYDSKEYLNCIYVLAFLLKAKLCNDLVQLPDSYINGMKIYYNSIKLENLGNVLVIDYNNISINESQLKLKNKDEIIEFLNSILSQGLILNMNHEIIYTFKSYVENESQKMYDEMNKKNVEQEKLNNQNLSEVYDIIANNHFNFLYRFTIDENNFINLYYNEKCCAFLEEAIKDGVSGFKKIDDPIFVSYPIEIDNGDVINHLIPFSNDVEKRILNDSRRINCVPYIRPYYTFPFGIKFSLFKNYDVNYYNIEKISEFDPNIKYMDLFEKNQAEIYYNAIRFIDYAVRRNQVLSEIIGYENVISLNNADLDNISIQGSGSVIPFTKLKRKK